MALVARPGCSMTANFESSRGGRSIGFDLVVKKLDF